MSRLLDRHLLAAVEEEQGSDHEDRDDHGACGRAQQVSQPGTVAVGIHEQGDELPGPERSQQTTGEPRVVQPEEPPRATASTSTQMPEKGSSLVICPASASMMPNTMVNAVSRASAQGANLREKKRAR